MTRFFGVVALVIWGGLWSVGTASAASPSVGKPSITIVSPKNGVVVHNGNITVSVAVSNFKLVKPVLKNPPVLKGNAGHIHYVLDNMTTFSADRDVSSSLDHNWTGVKPGRHTLIAYLATSQHLPFPTANPAKVTVYVQPAATTPRRGGGNGGGGKPVSRPNPGISSAPTTGGAAGLGHSPLDLSLLIAGLLAVFVGFLLLTRRFAFAATGRSSEARHDAPLSITTPTAPATASAPSLLDSAPSKEISASDENFAQWLASSEGSSAGSGADSPAQRETPALSSWPPPPGIRQAEPPATPPPVSPENPAGQPATRDPERDRAVEMARQWSGVVEGLVRQLDQQEAERRAMRERIATLEETVRRTQAMQQSLQGAGLESLSDDDLQAVQYVADSLMRDPDHIVNLAAVAQHARDLHRVVSNYTRIQRAINGDQVQ